jgi:hypothetical protein
MLRNEPSEQNIAYCVELALEQRCEICTRFDLPKPISCKQEAIETYHLYFHDGNRVPLKV